MFHLVEIGQGVNGYERLGKPLLMEQKQAQPRASGIVKTRLSSTELGKRLLFWGIGGLLACGITHTLTTPIDFKKVAGQKDSIPDINPMIKKIWIWEFYKILSTKYGPAAHYRGGICTCFGYCLQGFFKFGLYELGKYIFAEIIVAPTYLYSITCIISAASAEFVADIPLTPFEAVKNKYQELSKKDGELVYVYDGIKSMKDQTKGNFIGALYQQLLIKTWKKQIPYTIIKFFVFEYSLVFLFFVRHKITNRKKEGCSKLIQVLFVLLSGCISGFLCALLTQYMDNNQNVKEEQWKTMSMVDRLFGDLTLRASMLCLMTGAQWLIYDLFKTFVGINSHKKPEPTIHDIEIAKTEEEEEGKKDL